ncbi:MAG TPA: TPM domain-containing protein [Gemmatimonadaceae bacterium]
MFVLSLLAGVAALLQTGGIQIPAPVGLVNDFAHILPAATVEALSTLAQQVRVHSPGEMAIVTLPDLQGHDVSQVALQIGRQWKVGNVGQPGDVNRNAGVVILIVPKQTASDGRGRCRIEVGQGAEGYLTDGDAGTICREAVAGYFSKGDYAGGVTLVAVRVAQKIAQEYHFSLDSAIRAPAQPVDQSSRQSGGIPPVVFLFLLFFVLSLLGGRRSGCMPLLLFSAFTGGGRGGWGGGFGGGGFGGGGGGFGGFGGGGGFSGGGGGSSW